MNSAKQRELFILYLQECNAIDINEEKTRERIKRKRDKLIKKADLILIIVIGTSLGIMTIWSIIQEIMLKLH